MASLKKTTQALEILKNYEGDNPYILMLKRDMFVYEDPDAVGDFQINYILQNHDYKPKTINRVTKIPKWYGLDRQEKWGTEFVPEKILVCSIFGETDTSYSCYVQYRQSVPPVICFLPKKAIINNLFVEDYNKIEVDFDRYDRLSNAKQEGRKIQEHQKEAVKFLLSRKKCMLCLEQGLGKSLALSVASIEGNFDSVLIICPASLKTNWRDELSYYVDERYITVVDGFSDKNKSELEKFLGYGVGKSGKKKEELVEEAKQNGKWQDNRFVIVNYDILDDFYTLSNVRSESAVKELVENNPMLKYIYNKKSCIIMDEVHILTDSSSKRYKIINNLIKRGKPDSIYLATGTPVTNNPLNLYYLLALIENEITSDYNYYINTYCEAKKFPAKGERERCEKEFLKIKGKSSWYNLTNDEKDELKEYISKHARMITTATGSDNLEELQEKISHIYLRRTKEILNLPPKYIHEVFYDLTVNQKEEYNRLWEEYESEQKQIDQNKELNKELLEGSVYRGYLANIMVQKTIELANSIISRGDKVVIACCFDEELYSLRDYYKDKCVIYNGKMGTKDKDAAKYKFINDNNCMVFIGNIISAGKGITLVNSHDLIFNSFNYSNADCKQVEDRIHRIGQTHDCDIYYQFFKGTQCENVWNIVLRKQRITEALIKKEEEK